MQLTTSYQKLGEAYLGTDTYGGSLYIRIYAKYSEQDMQNNRSKVQYQSRYYFSGGSIYDTQSSGNVRGTNANQENFTKSDNYTRGEHDLVTTEAWVTHDADGTKTITASAYLNFPNWWWSATASGSATLPTLHKPPEITSCTITTESNTQLNNLGLATGTIAQYLSNKTFAVTAEFYDDAMLTNFSIYHNNVLIGTSNTNTLQINFANVSELQTTLSEGVYYVGLVASITDSKNGRNTALFNFPVVKYTKPTMEVTSTTIRRKTGGGTTLTENLAVLNFIGTSYNANNVIGNNNTPVLQYKIWKRDLTEPSYSTTKSRQLDSDSVLNYETGQITNFTISDGNIVINDYEIEDVGYLNAYKYKIKINDSFINVDASPYTKEDKVPTGISVWSEYRDHIDTIGLTINGYNPFEYSTNETVCGIWDDGYDTKPIYRKVFTGTITSTREEIDISSLYVDIPIKVWALNNYNTSYNSWVSSGFWADANSYFNAYVTNNTLVMTTAGFTNHPYIIIFEYTKSI